jgi:tetratricopeptide (TPR) repeat protein
MGQIAKAEEYLDLYVAEAGEYKAPMPLALEDAFFRVELHAFTEDHSGALDAVEELEAQVGGVPLLRLFPKYAKIWYYSLAEDRTGVSDAEALLAEIQDIVEKNPAPGLEAMALFADASVHSLRGEFTQGAELAGRAIPLLTALPQDQRAFIEAYILGDLYRRAEELPQAEEAILAGLKLEPSQPFFHAMLGLTYKDMGRRTDALLHLRKAIEVWEEADPDFKPAKDPREALAELEPAP